MAPIFVGSTNDDSNIRSNRIGFAVSTANPGSASEGDIYFNSTDKQLRGYDGSAWAAIGSGGSGGSGGSATAEFVASGTLSNGQTVILNSDGTVSAVSSSTISDSVGASSIPVVNGGGYYNTSAFGTSIFDSNSNKVVIFYRDDMDSYKGKAIVGTVSGTSMTFGSPGTFTTNIANPGLPSGATFDSNSNKVVVAYSDQSDSFKGKVNVGTVSGTSISFGTTVEFASGDLYQNGNYAIALTFDSNSNKVVIAYTDGGNSNYGTAIVGDVGGTSISFGTAVVFESASISYPAITFDSNTNKVAIGYRDNGNSSYGTGIVGTVSGTSISFGSPTVFSSGNTTYIDATFDSSNNKVVFAYRNESNSNYGTAIVGTVSGTSISFGSAAVFESADTKFISNTFDTSANKVVIAYSDVGNSSYGTAISGSVSGTSISFGTPVVFVSGALGVYTSTNYDSNSNKSVIVHKPPTYLQYVVFTAGSTTNNLTATNFIGFSDAAYSNGQTAAIQTVGSVDDAQSSLSAGSKYYVQNNGTLSTSAGSPSVLAGTAISATKIIVKK